MNECPPDFLALEIITYQFNFVVYLCRVYFPAKNRGATNYFNSIYPCWNEACKRLFQVACKLLAR